jgi:hypothetical protein
MIAAVVPVDFVRLVITAVVLAIACPVHTFALCVRTEHATRRF